MVLINDHARMYDIPILLAALLMDPVSAIDSNKSTLPGPTAIFFPVDTRHRGRRAREAFCLDFRSISQSLQ